MKFKTLILALLAITAVSFIGSKVYANPSFFLSTVQTSTATSSPSQIFIATATTTLDFDSYSSYDPLAVNKATLLIQQTASSTASVVSIFFQYSQDGIDWYQDSIDLASTTAGVSLQTDRTYSWTALTTNRIGKAIGIETPVRFLRVNIKQTAGTSTIWAQIVPSREVSR